MDNKNVILGSVAILVVVVFALVLFAPKGKESQAVKVDTSNIKVYKHIEKTEEQDGYYTECKLATDALLTVKNEFEKAQKLEEDKNVSEDNKINGDYKVVIDDKFLAFDKENNNVIYLKEKNSLYKFESKIYNVVINACE